jgi:hypothetical protein
MNQRVWKPLLVGIERAACKCDADYSLLCATLSKVVALRIAVSRFCCPSGFKRSEAMKGRRMYRFRYVVSITLVLEVTCG